MSPVRSGFYLQRYVVGGLCALLLLSRSSWPASGADTKPLNAILIVARDDLPDANFAHSIVLVMNNLGPGPIGIIINRPMQIPVSHLFPDIGRLAQVRDKVYFGGPVDFGSVWFLFRAATPPKQAIQACDGVFLSADRELLLQLLGRKTPMDGLRIFLGHAGWASDQLEAEIERHDWTSKRAERDAIFSGKSEYPWPSPREPVGRKSAQSDASPIDHPRLSMRSELK
jgi:putative transcriptional regulator